MTHIKPSAKVPAGLTMTRAGQEGELAPTSPTVARWELALRLRARRHELGIDVATITKHLGFTRNYWSQVENEKAILAEDKLLSLLGLFEFGNEEAAELSTLWIAARQRGWWTSYGGESEDEAERLYGLEYGAVKIRTFDQLVPGLLQTEEYAADLIASDPMSRPVEIDDFVKIRMRRQQRLFDQDPVQLTAIVSEAALHYQIGGRDVHRRQLLYLIGLAENHSNSIRLRVLPFTASQPGPLLGCSTLVFFDFASSFLPTIAWQEAIRPLGIVEDPEQTRRLTLCYEQGLIESLGVQESLELLKRVAAT